MELLLKGGPVMFVLLAVSVAGLAITLWKIVAVVQTRRTFSCTCDASKTKRQFGADAVRAAIANCAGTRHASLEELREVGARAACKELRSVELGLRELSTLAHISPFLGLLGTVIGMIGAFQNLEAAGMNVNPSILAGGVWVALLTTAFGISIALPLLLAFHLLDGVVDGIRDSFEALVEKESRDHAPKEFAENVTPLIAPEKGKTRKASNQH